MATASGYDKSNLKTDLTESVMIGVRIHGYLRRVFPHLSNDGLLAMRFINMTQSFVMLPDGSVRCRPDDFVMPDYLPAETKEAIDQSFILIGSHADDAKLIFAAFESNEFEVLE